MYGSSVERLIKFISGINSIVASVIGSISNISIGENPVNISNHTNPILKLNSTMIVINDEFKLISSKSFKNIYEVNNSYGSPYTEIFNLASELQNCVNVVNMHPTVKYYDEINKIINSLRNLYQHTTDSKYACIIYHDHIQMGYDKIIHKTL